MKKLAYVTNTSLSHSSGGGSGVNFATHKQLNKVFDIQKTVVIKPKQDFLNKLKSVVLKKMGFKRNYHAFSESILNDISIQFNLQTKTLNDIDCYFFHGFTQWIKTKPSKPYFCFNDACFATYVDIFNNASEFTNKDLERIFKQEKEWLDSAALVFFRSNWALENTKKRYNLEGNNFVNVGVGGFIDVPLKDTFNKKRNFLFIAREFLPKGGLEVVNAFKVLVKKYDDLTLSIIGDDPGEDIKSINNVNYLGFFNKQIDEERIKLSNIFSDVFALVHPTLKDINPLVIVELSYYGCPVIASNKFAIPEYLIDEKSGFLIKNPRDVNEIVDLMEKMILMDSVKYNAMRSFARLNAISNSTWDHVGQKIIKHINNKIASLNA